MKERAKIAESKAAKTSRLEAECMRKHKMFLVTSKELDMVKLKLNEY
jgi:hypothetical protein